MSAVLLTHTKNTFFCVFLTCTSWLLSVSLSICSILCRILRWFLIFVDLQYIIITYLIYDSCLPVFCRLDCEVAILTNPILCFPFLPVHVGAVVLQHVHVHEVLAAVLALVLEPLNFQTFQGGHLFWERLVDFFFVASKGGTALEVDNAQLAIDVGEIGCWGAPDFAVPFFYVIHQHIFCHELQAALLASEFTIAISDSGFQ